MLQSSVSLGDREAEKPIALERRRPTEEVVVRIPELTQVCCHSIQVRVMTTGHDQLIRDSARLKICHGEVTNLKRMIDQLIVVGSSVSTEASVIYVDRRHRGRDAPSRTLRTQEQTGAIEETACAVQICPTHREVECVDLDRDQQLPTLIAATPGTLVELLHCESAAGGLCANTDDVACILP